MMTFSWKTTAVNADVSVEITNKLSGFRELENPVREARVSTVVFKEFQMSSVKRDEKIPEFKF